MHALPKMLYYRIHGENMESHEIQDYKFHNTPL